MCEGIQNPDNPRYACDCHRHRDVIEHVHWLHVGFSTVIEYVGDPYYDELQDADLQKHLIGALTEKLEWLKAAKPREARTLVIDTETEIDGRRCEACEANDAANYEPDFDDLED